DTDWADGLGYCAVNSSRVRRRSTFTVPHDGRHRASRASRGHSGWTGVDHDTCLLDHDCSHHRSVELHRRGHRRLYTFQNGGIVFRRVAKTGELLYSGRPGALGYYYSSPVAADDKIYRASADGVVVVLEASEKLNILATNNLDGPILATPALAG